MGTWWFKVTFLGWLSDPFKGLSDLQLGDQKVTLNHQESIFFVGVQFAYYWGRLYISCTGFFIGGGLVDESIKNCGEDHTF